MKLEDLKPGLRVQDHRGNYWHVLGQAEHTEEPGQLFVIYVPALSDLDAADLSSIIASSKLMATPARPEDCGPFAGPKAFLSAVRDGGGWVERFRPA